MCGSNKERNKFCHHTDTEFYQKNVVTEQLKILIPYETAFPTNEIRKADCFFNRKEHFT